MRLFFEHWRLFFEVLSLILAIIALGVCVYHLYEIKHVTSALSTRYLGKFPYFLRDIVELMNGARDKLIIFCDFPGYGDFTDPAWGLQYRQVLQRLRLKQLRKEFELELTCLHPDWRKKFLQEQFPPGDWEDWTNDPKKRKKAQEFLNYHLGILMAHCGVSEPSKASLGDIVKVMDVVDANILQEEFGGQGKEIPSTMPIYFWIADEQIAIFSIPALSTEALEYGFKTSDQKLIQGLMEVRLRYRKTTTVT